MQCMFQAHNCHVNQGKLPFVLLRIVQRVPLPCWRARIRGSAGAGGAGGAGSAHLHQQAPVPLCPSRLLASAFRSLTHVLRQHAAPEASGFFSHPSGLFLLTPAHLSSVETGTACLLRALVGISAGRTASPSLLAAGDRASDGHLNQQDGLRCLLTMWLRNYCKDTEVIVCCVHREARQSDVQRSTYKSKDEWPCGQ